MYSKQHDRKYVVYSDVMCCTASYLDDFQIVVVLSHRTLVLTDGNFKFSVHSTLYPSSHATPKAQFVLLELQCQTGMPAGYLMLHPENSMEQISYIIIEAVG